MQILSVHDEAFRNYGSVLTGYDFTALLTALSRQEKPTDGTVYVPSCAALESTPSFAALRDGFFGGMPIQLGYCNGTNRTLNALEYHRDCELNIMQYDTVILVAKQEEISPDFRLDTSCVKAFLVPAGTGVALYATTLHYAPCDAVQGQGFRAAIVLPRGTNCEKPQITERNAEDRLLFAANKWLLAHPDAPEAQQGAWVGLTGPNITL